MSVGIALTKAGVDSRSGNLAWTLIDTLEPDPCLPGAAGHDPRRHPHRPGVHHGEVAILKSAFTDLDKLYGIFRGTQTQASGYDFTTFAGQLIADMVQPGGSSPREAVTACQHRPSSSTRTPTRPRGNSRPRS